MLREQPEADILDAPATNGSNGSGTIETVADANRLSVTTMRTKSDMRLDDPTVAGKTRAYPEAVIDDVMWLAGYCRDRCAGRRDLLVFEARKLGFKSVSENYVYKIFTGRYFTPDGKGGLIGSVDNFTQLVKSLRDGVQKAARAGQSIFVETGTWRRISNYIDVRRMPGNVIKFGVIVGPTGGQKSECVKRYCELNNHGKCVHLEAPATASMMEFFCDLAECYGHTKWASSAVQQRRIADSVGPKNLIVVDNVQRLYRPGQGGDQPVFNYLQKMQDKTKCAVILMFASIESKFLTDGLEKGYFEQFEGRAGGRENFLTLDEYTPREDLIDIATAYQMPDAGEDATIDYLEKLSRLPGRCRILFDALQRAKREANDTGAKVTMALIKEVRGEAA